MLLIFIGVVGLCIGSFVNAFTWRLHAQTMLRESAEKKGKGLDVRTKARLKELSIRTGRSMCSQCGHVLQAKDLIPVLSWIWLRGKCRYCHKKIDDTPVAELLGVTVFITSYLFWPYEVTGYGAVLLAIWLVAQVYILALAVYDARWYILPTTLIMPLGVLGAMFAGVRIANSANMLSAFIATLGAVLLLWGVFRLLYAISKGEWIGFGDVRLAIPLALFAGSPLQVCVLLFVASLIGTIAALPQLVRGTKTARQPLPFGPYLLIGCMFSVLWGEASLNALDSILFSM